MPSTAFPRNSESTASQKVEITTAAPGDTALSEGHRSRLLDRFSKNGLPALHDHEILELILTYAIPRRDTKPMAKELLKRYKSINGVMNAPVAELESIKGIGRRSALIFPLLRDTMAYCLKEKYEKQPLVSHRHDVEEYLRFYFGGRRDEYVAAVYLDNGNHILQTDLISEGTVNQCVIYPRTIVERALKCGAASIILAHNHPGGALRPSEADWVITERLYTVCKLLEIPLLDHIIISKQKVVSLRELPRWPK